MSILINGDTKVICQGITGSFGALHTKGCLDYGTKLVGGVTPGKGGKKDDNGLPIFNTVRDAVEGAGAEATMIFVPPAFSGDAILEAADAGIKVICCITEGVPTEDMIKVKAMLREYPTANLIGPNCPGIISPGVKVSGEGADSRYKNGCKIGIMPGYIHMNKADATTGKAVGIISRSGTLTYEAVWQTSNYGLGQTTCIGIGGDPVKGLNFIELLEMFNNDPDTDGVLMIGEIGGSDETDAGHWVKANMKKPVAAFIAGQTAPKGKRMGHAGAIIGGADDTAAAKIKSLESDGVTVAMSPADMGKAMIAAMGLG